MAPNIDPNVVFKNIMIATVILGIVAFAALGFRSGSINTVGQGGGSWSNGNSWGGGDSGWRNDRGWRGGDDDHDDYDDDD